MAYETWGTLNAERDNAVLVLHALTGDSHVVGPAGPDQPTPGWWDGLVGPGAPLDTDRFFVRGRQRARRLPGHHRAVVDRARRPALRLAVSRGSPSATRSPPRSRWPTGSASTGSPRCSAARWAACGRWSGRSAPGPGRAAASRSPPARPSPATRSPGASRSSRRSGRTRNFRGGDYYDGPSRRWPAWPWPGRSRTPPTGRRWSWTPGSAGPRRAARTRCAGGRFAVQSYLEHHGDKLGRRFDPNSYLVLTEAMNCARHRPRPRRRRRCAATDLGRADGRRGRLRPAVPAGPGRAARHRADRPAADHDPLRLRPRRLPHRGRRHREGGPGRGRPTPR